MLKYEKNSLQRLTDRNIPSTLERFVKKEAREATKENFCPIYGAAKRFSKKTLNRRAADNTTNSRPYLLVNFQKVAQNVVSILLKTQTITACKATLLKTPVGIAVKTKQSSGNQVVLMEKKMYMGHRHRNFQ